MPMMCVDENFIKEYLLDQKVTTCETPYYEERCIKTGFKEIDDRCGGLMRGETYVITGRPGMGKTSFALNIWANLLRNKEGFYRTVFFSLAESKKFIVMQLAKIMGANYSGENFNSSKKNNDVLEKIATGFSCIDDDSWQSMEEIYRSCKTVEGNIDLIIIDYAQCVRSEDNGNLVKTLDEILEQAKKIAMEFNCALIIISQAPKYVETWINHRPMLDDFMRAGEEIDKADHIWAIYRDDYYYKESEKPGLAEIIVLKPMRDVKTIELAWLPEYCKFSNLSYCKL